MRTLTPERRALAAAYLPLADAIARPFREARPELAADIGAVAALAICQAALAYIEGPVAFPGYIRKAVAGSIVRFLQAERDGGIRGLGEARSDPGRPRTVFVAEVVVAAPATSPPGEEAEAVLARLPAKHAAALRSVYLEGRTQREAAVAIGCSQPEVNRLIRGCRALLAG